MKAGDTFLYVPCNPANHNHRLPQCGITMTAPQHWMELRRTLVFGACLKPQVLEPPTETAPLRYGDLNFLSSLWLSESGRFLSPLPPVLFASGRCPIGNGKADAKGLLDPNYHL